MTWLDWLVILVYVAGLIALGLRASRGERTVASHLRANRSLPAWAVVFSVLATEVSAATYIGVPEKGYNGDWTYLQYSIGALLGKWALAALLIPLYWRLDLTTVYGFLGQRIGPRSQKASAWAFVVGRLIASGVRLFIAALAFSVVTGFPLAIAIAAMALISTAYTFLGGLKAVVWTDVAQGSIFFLGAALALGVGLHQLGLPLGDVAREVWDAGKLQALNPARPERVFATPSWLPAAIVGGLFLTLATHGTDQENVQHLLNTRTASSSGRSLWVSGLCTFPIVALFLSVGTMLWVYHRHLPAQGYSAADSPRIFPNFIMHVLPPGVRGLVFAGLFAAAISSLAATLNAVSATWTSDIRPRAQDDRAGLLRVRAITCVVGFLLMLVGLFFAWYARSSGGELVEIALAAMTILYGGILGGFLCPLLFRTRGSDRSVPLGMALGIVSGALLFFQVEIFGLQHGKLIEWPWFIPISASATLLVAILGKRSIPDATPDALSKESPCELVPVPSPQSSRSRLSPSPATPTPSASLASTASPRPRPRDTK